MACFLVSAAEAVVATAAANAAKKEETKNSASTDRKTNPRLSTEAEVTIPWSRKLKWLSGLLWGGALLLAYEHVWHGEVVPWFPFLTAMNDPGDTAEMLHEMSTIGVTMACIVTAVWACICVAADAIVKRKPATSSADAAAQ